MTTTRLVLAFTILLAAGIRAQDQAVFRARTDVVSVGVSVKKGDTAIVALSAADFVLLDNGVRQQIDAVSIEALPVDVTLFMDTSESTAGARDEMQRAIRKIAAMLRPGDRFRLLTIGHSVYETVPWVEAGATFDVNARIVAGISLVYDAVAMALRHSAAAGRRHLIVAMTDGEDCGSMTDPSVLVQLAGRSDAVLHWIEMRGSGTGGTMAYCYMAPIDPEKLRSAAELTGGARHAGVYANPDPVKEFDRLFAEFRQSYVLMFSPIGVPAPGWHAVAVSVPKGRGEFTIRARAGYFGG